MAKKLTTAQFIERAKEVHGDKYDYSKVVYVNSDTKVSITCSEHGEFYQTPHSHRKGSGCVKCANQAKKGTISPRLLTQDVVIARFRATHGDKYDYSKVAYVDAHTHVTIICPVHGEFRSSASAHWKKTGCMQCSLILAAHRQRHTTNEFIARARAKHGDRYCYSKVVHEDSKLPVTITCPMHGDFQQRPNSHTQGHGCPSCGLDTIKAASGDADAPTSLYLVSITGYWGACLKVGITTTSVRKRMSSWGRYCDDYTILRTYDSTYLECCQLEAMLLSRVDTSTSPVPRRAGGSTECFILSEAEALELWSKTLM